MRTCLAAATLLLLLAAPAAPAAAQGVPDYIPDEPGESLLDRERERQRERYRSFFSRFFSVGGVAMAPITRNGLGYASEAGIGMHLDSGDALFLAVGTRLFPDAQRFSAPAGLGPSASAPELYAAVGYELSATRALGESAFADRAALRMGVGVLVARTGAITLDIGPTYELFRGQLRGHNWSLPVGPRLTVAMISDPDVTLARTFLGLNAGFRWQFMGRERMD